MSHFLHDNRDGYGGDETGTRAPRRNERTRAAPYNSGGKRVAEGTTVTVTGLPKSLSWQDLKDAFKDAGVVTRADCAGDGSGSVTFKEKSDAHWAAKNWSGVAFKGKVITVKVQRANQQAAAKPRVGRSGGRGGDRGGRSGGGRGSGRGGGREAKVTAEQLEKDMNAYWAKSGDKGKEKISTDLDDDMDAYFAKKGDAKATEKKTETKTEATTTETTAAPVTTEAVEEKAE